MTTRDRTPWEMLREPFPDHMVGKLPKGGVMLDYVGHAAVTDRLLQVDPTWTWEPFAISSEGLPQLDRVGNLWIRLTVNGVTRVGVGDGKNAKECISDAIRNAAMRFGVALDLWAKEDLRAQEPPPEPVPEAPKAKPSTVASRRRMHALFHEAGIEGREPRLTYTVGIINRGITTSTEMTAAEVKAVSDALKETASNPGDAVSGGPEPPPPAPGPPESHNPDHESYTELRKTALATPQQREKLDDLLAEAMETRTGAIPDLWAQVAAYRKINLAELMVTLEARPGQPLLWAPLRDSLTRVEAGDLADHLTAQRVELGLPEPDIPF